MADLGYSTGKQRITQMRIDGPEPGSRSFVGKLNQRSWP